MCSAPFPSLPVPHFSVLFPSFPSFLPCLFCGWGWGRGRQLVRGILSSSVLYMYVLCFKYRFSTSSSVLGPTCHSHVHAPWYLWVRSSFWGPMGKTVSHHLQPLFCVLIRETPLLLPFFQFPDSQWPFPRVDDFPPSLTSVRFLAPQFLFLESRFHNCSDFHLMNLLKCSLKRKRL